MLTEKNRNLYSERIESPCDELSRTFGKDTNGRKNKFCKEKEKQEILEKNKVLQKNEKSCKEKNEISSKEKINNPA